MHLTEKDREDMDWIGMSQDMVLVVMVVNLSVS
jgi:hypothetical protein